MAKQRLIAVRQFIRDVRQEMTRTNLMRKYNLNEIQLNRAVQRLLDLKHLTEKEGQRLLSLGRTRIDRHEIARDVLSLLKKYQLSLNQFKSELESVRGSKAFLEENPISVTTGVRKIRRPRVNGREFADDVRLGMDYDNLAMKYNLSHAQVRQVIQKLVSMNMLEADVADRTVPFDMRRTIKELEAE